MIIEKQDKFFVKVWSDGRSVYLTKLVDGEWVDCVYNTREEAEKALKDYNDFYTFWKE